MCSWTVFINDQMWEREIRGGGTRPPEDMYDGIPLRCRIRFDVIAMPLSQLDKRKDGNSLNCKKM
jgi:hypothetical protein